MKIEFVQPRFQGARFDEHTLPIEVARDLAAYETLVLELAKHLFLIDYPDRQRVPKGFAADFQLHLERVDGGSSRPLLSIITAGALAFGTSTNVYLEKARDLISECIAAPAGQLPDAFPREMLAYFNQIGRSLKDDESMELAVKNGGVATLTPERRKHLVLAADQVYEREVELTGSIGEADWEKSTFRLRRSDGSSAVIPMSSSFHAQARKYGGQVRHQVMVAGIGTFDSWDNLQKVISTTSIDIQPDYQLASRFEELQAMEDGWFDGKGTAPDKNKLKFIASKMIGHYPEKLPLPIIIPTPEGNLLFEWTSQGDPSLDIDLQTMKAEFHAFRSPQADLESDFSLTDERNWPAFYSFLVNNFTSRLS